MLNPLPMKTVFARKQHLLLSTQKAHKTLKRLCKHFEHKVTVQWDTEDGLIYFEEGICAMSANDKNLSLRCEADSLDDLVAITDTMDRHISGLCRDERFAMKWCDLQ